MSGDAPRGAMKIAEDMRRWKLGNESQQIGDVLNAFSARARLMRDLQLAVARSPLAVARMLHDAAESDLDRAAEPEQNDGTIRYAGGWCAPLEAVGQDEGDVPPAGGWCPPGPETVDDLTSGETKDDDNGRDLTDEAWSLYDAAVRSGNHATALHCLHLVDRLARDE